MKPTFVIFQLEEIDSWDKYPEDYSSFVEEALEAFNDLNDTEWSRDQFISYLRDFKEVDSSTDYVNGDPTNTVVVYHAPTDTYYQGQHFWDSWGGNGGFDDPYTEHPVKVTKQPVVRDEWVEVTDAV